MHYDLAKALPAIAQGIPLSDNKRILSTPHRFLEGAKHELLEAFLPQGKCILFLKDVTKVLQRGLTDTVIGVGHKALMLGPVPCGTHGARDLGENEVCVGGYIDVRPMPAEIAGWM